MSTITVRVTEEEKIFLDKMAQFEGKSLSELMKSKTLAALEDTYDANVADKYFEEYLESKQSSPLSDLLDEFDI